MMQTQSTLLEPNDVLYRIKRGLSGYVSYLAACEMNPSFSEYLLYEPILRIFTARGFSVECEAMCPGIPSSTIGDKKRLDFVAHKDALTLAIEVKWTKKRRPAVKTDVDKLTACLGSKKGWRAFLIVFGAKSCIDRLRLPDGKFTERGTKRIADLGKTKFGCRVYELAKPCATGSSRSRSATRS